MDGVTELPTLPDSLRVPRLVDDALPVSVWQWHGAEPLEDEGEERMPHTSMNTASMPIA